MLSQCPAAADRLEPPLAAGLAQTAVEALECRAMLDDDQTGRVKRCSDFDAVPLDFALGAIPAAIPVQWRDAGQGGDLVATDLAELGLFGDQSTGDDIADAGAICGRASGFRPVADWPSKA
jgi:hypothetical protein